MAFNFNLPSTTTSYANLASFPATGSSSILYKALNNNKLYTWDGTKYNEVDKKFASSWGSVSAAPETSAVTKDEVGLGNVDNTADLDKPVSTATQTALNAKQATLVSATNIKTINGNSLLGSGNLTISGGGGGGGVHAVVKPTTGQVVSASLTGANLNTIFATANRLTAQPFIPANTFTSANLYLNVSSFGIGALARILIYSDLNGIPNTKLYESANLDCSTNGIKTATTSFTFTAGTTYWICTHASLGSGFTSFTPASVISILISGTSNIQSYIYTYTFGSAPTTLTGQGNSVTAIPAVFITSA